MERLWDADENYVDEHTLTTSISRIRGKIEADGDTYIKTIYELGISGWEARENESGENLCKKVIPAGMQWYGSFDACYLRSCFMGGRADVDVGLRHASDALCPCMDVPSDDCLWQTAFRIYQRAVPGNGSMISGSGEPMHAADSETLFARISYRLSRLYGIMQENRRKVDEERQELQMLVLDVSHQVKTPISNLKMVTDTLLSKSATEEQWKFLQGIRNQTDKLEFLFQALVKTSRLETGAIRMEKKDAPLIDTLAMACSDIVYAAEKRTLP